MKIYLVIAYVRNGTRAQWPTVVKVFGTEEKEGAWVKEKTPHLTKDGELYIEEHEVIE